MKTITIKKKKMGIKHISEVQIPSNTSRLYLQGNKIEKIEGLGKRPKLKSLLLSTNEISKIENLEGLPNLETLQISNNPISKIEGIEHLTKLRHLTLENCKIERLENLDELESLVKLYLSGNDISDLSGLKNLKRLRILHLNNCQLTDLSTLPYLKNLFVLKLSGNKLTDVKGIERFEKLTSLNLENNPGLPEEFQKDMIHDDTIADIFVANKASREQLVAVCRSLLMAEFEKAIRGLNLSESICNPSPKLMVHVMAELLTEKKTTPPGVCLYCKERLDPNDKKNYPFWLREEVDKLIKKINRFIPKSRLERDKHETLVTFQRVYFNLWGDTMTTERGIKGKKFIHKYQVGKLQNFQFPVLINPLCQRCAREFLEGAKDVLGSVKKIGSYDGKKKSLWDATDRYGELIKQQIRK
ncbi:MAG: leucine-rich repeat protein [Candidatus Lokiarchaeota archaeon]|nr:leucine-rich repeat protein [Candidatus Lokiarchaeota archaeon]